MKMKISLLERHCEQTLGFSDNDLIKHFIFLFFPLFSNSISSTSVKQNNDNNNNNK